MTKLTQALEKSLAFLVVAVLLAGIAPIAALAGQSAMPRDPYSNLPMDVRFIGAKACRVDNTTTATACATTSGVLYAICAYGTAAVAGKGTMAFDTANATHTSGFQALNQAISPIVYATNAASLTGNDAVMPKCWIPPVPVRFETGLGMKQDDAGHDSLGLYRLDSGTNP